jgi:Zn finger protein HypA/HybF involved in hydrogenase expression
MTARITTAQNAAEINALKVQLEGIAAMLAAHFAEPAKATPAKAATTAPKAVGTLVCEDCGTETERKSLNQKRCPSCREAKAQGSNASRQQWKDAKAAADLKHGKGKGIPEWGVPVLMTLSQALEAGLVVIDGEGNLGPAVKAEAPKAPKAPKAKKVEAPKVEAVDPMLEKARFLVEQGGFTVEEAARLIAAM